MPLTNSTMQRGAALLVSLIMLVVITLMVTAAFSLSNNDLKAVGNMQMRREAIAAANKAIEMVISSPFASSPEAETISVDINNDGSPDYNVQIAAPICVRARPASADGLCSDPDLCGSGAWDSVWDIEATVDDAAAGTAVQAHAGVTLRITDAQKNSSCS